MMVKPRGFYSIVQYSPDRWKHEWTNVGVVLCVPDVDYLEMNIRIVGEDDFMDMVCNEIRDRIKTEKQRLMTFDEFKVFANNRANNINLTGPHPTKVVHPGLFLRDLYFEYVLNSKIYPCPFCKSKDVELTSIFEGYYHVHCKGCNANGPDFVEFEHENVYEEAIVAWNAVGRNDDEKL